MEKELIKFNDPVVRNLRGVNFEEAKDWWQDKDLLVFPLNKCAKQIYACIRIVNEKYWTALISLQSGYARLISVRLSRKDEVLMYEKCC